MRGVSWEGLHVCIDEARRVAYELNLPDEKKKRGTESTERTIEVFEQPAVGIQRINARLRARLPLHVAAAYPGGLAHQAPLHPTLEIADHCEGGAIHPHPPGGVGACVRTYGHPKARTADVSPALKFNSTIQGSRSSSGNGRSIRTRYPHRPPCPYSGQVESHP